jgi:hypothetical protein
MWNTSLSAKCHQLKKYNQGTKRQYHACGDFFLLVTSSSILTADTDLISDNFQLQSDFQLRDTLHCVADKVIENVVDFRVDGKDHVFEYTGEIISLGQMPLKRVMVKEFFFVGRIRCCYSKQPIGATMQLKTFMP